MVGAMSRDPGARVTIKHSKPGDIVLLVRNTNHCRVCVLHLDPPTLHGGQAIPEATSNFGLIIFLGLRLV